MTLNQYTQAIRDAIAAGDHIERRGPSFYAVIDGKYLLLHYHIAQRLLGRPATQEDLVQLYGEENSVVFTLASIFSERSAAYASCSQFTGGRMRAVHARKLIAKAVQEPACV